MPISRLAERFAAHRDPAAGELAIEEYRLALGEDLERGPRSHRFDRREDAGHRLRRLETARVEGGGGALRRRRRLGRRALRREQHLPIAAADLVLLVIEPLARHDGEE